MPGEAGSEGAAPRWQRRLAALSRGIEGALLAASAVLLVFLSVTLFLQVLYRYVIKAPLPWTEEGARFALVWFALLAAAVGARKGQHFVFRWGTLLLPAPARWWLRQAVTVVVLVILAIIIVEGTLYLRIVADQTATATRVNMRLPFAGIPVALGCFFLIYLLDLADAVLALRTGRCFSAKEASEVEIYRRLSEREAREAPPASAGAPR